MPQLDPIIFGFEYWGILVLLLVGYLVMALESFVDIESSIGVRESTFKFFNLCQEYFRTLGDAIGTIFLNFSGFRS